MAECSCFPLKNLKNIKQFQRMNYTRSICSNRKKMQRMTVEVRGKMINIQMQWRTCSSSHIIRTTPSQLKNELSAWSLIIRKSWKEHALGRTLKLSELLLNKRLKQRGLGKLSTKNIWSKTPVVFVLALKRAGTDTEQTKARFGAQASRMWRRNFVL